MTFLRSFVSYRRVFSSGLIMRYTVSHVGGSVATEMKNIVCCLTFYFTHQRIDTQRVECRL